MHFGLFCLNPQRDAAKSPGDIYGETTDQVRLAEQIGFDIAWFAEHHFSNYCLCPSPITMATYMAALTTRIRLGTAVIVAPLYQPLRMLEDLAVLDQLSGGRSVLGFGSGYQAYEFHKFGVDLKAGRDIFLETLEVTEQFIRSGTVEYAGKHISVPETHFSVRLQQSRPAIYVAGLASDPETQARSARGGYVPFFTTGWSTLEEIRKTRDKVTTAYAATGGKPEEAPYAMQRYVFVTDDRAEALRASEGARYIRRIALSMRNQYARLQGAWLEEIAAPDEPPLEMIAERLIVGDAERCGAKLVEEITELRPTHISCFMAIPGIEPKRILKSMERFGGEVMPLLSKHFGGLDRVGAVEPRASVPAAAA